MTSKTVDELKGQVEGGPFLANRISGAMPLPSATRLSARLPANPR